MGILGALNQAYHASGREGSLAAGQRAGTRVERQLRPSQRLEPRSAPATREDPLVERIRADDREAFNELVRTYHLPLRSYIRSLTSSASVAEEVVQDLFLNIWRMRATWSVRSSLAGYLFGAAQKGAFHVRRKSRRFELWQRDVTERDEAPLMGQSDASADRQVEALELKAALARAIDRLPLRRRQVAFLRFQQGLTCPEIASIMGVTVKAVERQAAKAIVILRTELASYLGR